MPSNQRKDPGWNGPLNVKVNWIRIQIEGGTKRVFYEGQNGEGCYFDLQGNLAWVTDLVQAFLSDTAFNTHASTTNPVPLSIPQHLGFWDTNVISHP